MTDVIEDRVAYRTCPLCEAGCGLEIALRGDMVQRIRGDRDDVFSHGFICPKGSTLKQLHEDPDRVQTPLVKREGAFVPVSWDEAFAVIEQRLAPIVERHGREAVAIYLGNPNAHNLDSLLYTRFMVKALATPNLYSASTVDQRPKEITNSLMYGGMLSAAVPDIDRTDHIVLLGANPYASNGSLATAPDWPGRLEAIKTRGGRVVVVDPRRTKTAEEATEHVAIRPGTDAHLLMAMVHVLFADGLVTLGAASGYVNGIEDVRALSADITPERAASICGIDAETIRRLTRELAAARAGVVYGRIGTCTQEFGTLASWLVDVLNVLTGNLDRPGGAMFARPAAGGPNTRGKARLGREVKLGRWTSRVRGLGETFGELPAVCMAEEIETPGHGQVRALITVAGNPVLSTPNGGRLDAALNSLEFMVSVDIYINETTRHADVILPSPSVLTKGHYDLGLLQLAIRNVAHYSPPVLSRPDGQLAEWEILAKLALIADGRGAGADPSLVDDEAIAGMVHHSVTDEHSALHGMDADKVLGDLAPRAGPERLLDFMLRTGPYGDQFGAGPPDGLSLDLLLEHPHGIDYGALEPRLPEVLRTPTGMIELAPPPLVADVDRLRASFDRKMTGGFVLIGRRELRSNNSWMHNVNVLVNGRPQCTMQIHPEDAARLGLATGAHARVTSRTGSVVVPVDVTDGIMTGVVSIPHGWGHDLDGVEMQVAAAHAGVNSNLLADEDLFDPLSGNAVLNGIPVEVCAAV